MMGKRRNMARNTMNKFNTDLTVAIRHFEIHNRTEGKSPRTVHWYNQVLTLFCRWLSENARPTSLDAIDEMVVREFILDLQGRPGSRGETVSSHTIYNRVNALRAFFAWLDRKGYTDGHALADLKQPKTARLIVEPLTKEEIGKLFAVINSSTLLGARNAALISVMLDTGLRVSEVADLKERDVHLEEQFVKVMGKASKERMVSFGTACQKALLDYQYRFRMDAVHGAEEAFFLSIDGYPMAAVGIQSLVKRLSKASGVHRMYPHLLRHTYATMFLINGGDVFLLKQNLGHTTLTMVENYLHVASQVAAVRSQRFSPLDKLNIREGRRFRHARRTTGGGDPGIYPNGGVGSPSTRRRRTTATRQTRT